MANILIIKTTTTISITEITQVLDKGKRLLSDIAIASGYTSLYHMEDKGQCIRRQLYMYLYAIESWNTTINAQNYYDQKHLISLLSKVEQLFYICTVKRPC